MIFARETAVSEITPFSYCPISRTRTIATRANGWNELQYYAAEQYPILALNSAMLVCIAVAESTSRQYYLVSVLVLQTLFVIFHTTVNLSGVA